MAPTRAPCVSYHVKTRKRARPFSESRLSQLDGTVTKQSKSLEKITTLLEKLNGSMEALVEVERRKSSLVAQMRGGSAPGTGGGSTSTPAPGPTPGPASGPAVSTPSTAAQAMAAGIPQATLGTGVVFTPQTPNVQPKLMPTNLTPPMPLGFPPAPAFTGQNYGPPPAPAAGYTNTL